MSDSDAAKRLNAALEGRYRIERELGEGGMATVYLADDVKHERKVALKVLKPELAAVVGAERFLAEIKTTANLQHPHILPLHDSGEADGFLYYVMPYIEGETLRDRLEREKQLPVDEAVKIATDVAEALHSAHKQGVIHRDIKPANILLSEGRPLVADFGIALAVAQAGGGRLTETGLSMGTPYYMSPEQASADRDPAPASDVYSLGCVLYEMLVGEPPYTGGSAQAVLAKILMGDAPAPTVLRPAIPAHVDAAVRKSLEKLSADRFKGAQDFSNALADPAYRHGEMAAVAAGSGATPWRSAAAVFASLFLVAAGVAGWSMLRSEPPEPVLRFSLKTVENQLPSEWLGISPDGSAMVASYRDVDGNWRLWLRRWSDLIATPIPGIEEPVHDPVISPDGLEVAFFQAGGELKVSSLSGGLDRTLAEGTSCCGRWGGDGFFYFAANAGHIRRVPTTGGLVEDVTSLGAEDGGTHGYLHPLPGGEVGLFTVFSTPPRIESVRFSTGERRVVTSGVRSYLTPTGHLVVGTADGRLTAAPFDVKSAELTGAPVPVVEGVTTKNGDIAYTLSENGSLLYWRGASSTELAEFIWLARDGTVTPVVPGWAVDPGIGGYGWRLSPDGNRIAYGDMGGGDGGEIWIKDLVGGPLSRLTFDAGSDGRPEWLPDGRELLFTSTRASGDAAGRRSIWKRRVDGTGVPELILAPEISVDEFTQSPDGSWILFHAEGSSSRDIFAHRLGGDGQVTPLLASPDFHEVEPAVSPDGQWLAYASNESGVYQIYVRPFPNVGDARWQISSIGLGASGPRWSPDGREIFFGSFAGDMVVAQVDARSGFRVLGSQAFYSGDVIAAASTSGWFDVAPDGERLLMARRLAGGREPELILVQNFFEDLKRLVPN